MITDAGSPGDLRKIGAETLTLTGANTYSGTTVVSAGALRVDGTIVSAAGTSVEDGATLTGSGWIEGAVAVADGGTLSPGTGARLLRTGNLSLGAGATFVVDLYGTTPGITHDQVEVNGSVDLTGAVLDASLGFAATGEETFVLIDNDGVDSVTGTFAELPERAVVELGGHTYRITYQYRGNDVALVPNEAPVADAGFAEALIEGVPFTFDGTGSRDADGDALTYLWDFGDSQTATGAQPTHTYADQGTYPVTLTVSDGHGKSDTDEFVVTVDNAAPEIVSITADPVAAGVEATVTVTATDVSADTLS